METITFTRQMGLTHAEFFKSLPKAVEPYSYTVNQNMVSVNCDERSLIISLGPQQIRKIALLEIPWVEVTFRFDYFTEDQKIQFMEKFDLYFQRGGG